MAMYQILNDDFQMVEEPIFAERGLRERSDLQRLLKKLIAGSPSRD
ncbi:hypothetical protein [Sedimenticola hydrogenitrophicus]|nr:hypothetical protein [Sedimenticola hydrogenitrophicus]